MTLLFGVDVSRHQGTIDWPRVAAADIRFAICRAGLATTPDATFARNRKGAADAGLVPGAYWFLYPATVISPEKQADLYVSVVGDPAGMVIALDIERDKTNLPNGADAMRFIKRLRTHWPTHPLTLYAPAWYWRQIGNPKLARYGALWHSRYVTPLSTPLSPRGYYERVPESFWTVSHGGWTRPTILQFTSSSSVPGVTGRCDANAVQAADLAALTGLPDTATGDTDVRIRITEWAAPRPFILAAPARSFAATEPFRDLGEVSGDVQTDAEVVIDQTGFPNGTFVRIITGPAGRRLVEKSAGTLGEATNRTVAGFAERLRADLPSFIDQKVKEYGA